ncbi:MAG: hypothetical protein GXO50_08065, partial [Chlorobi bacterium]|nr:hypothetical protein [Chlorobiota bacterium]
KKSSFTPVIVLFLLFLSCKGQIEPVPEEINTDLLTTKTRHIVKAVYVNSTGLESSISDAWQECSFKSTYKFNDDLTYFVADSCFEDTVIYHWQFIENKSKINIYRADTVQYLILKLNDEELKLEQLNNGTDFRKIYIYR